MNILILILMLLCSALFFAIFVATSSKLTFFLWSLSAAGLAYSVLRLAFDYGGAVLRWLLWLVSMFAIFVLVVLNSLIQLIVHDPVASVVFIAWVLFMLLNTEARWRVIKGRLVAIHDWWDERERGKVRTRAYQEYKGAVKKDDSGWSTYENKARKVLSK